MNSRILHFLVGGGLALIAFGTGFPAENAGRETPSPPTSEEVQTFINRNGSDIRKLWSLAGQRYKSRTFADSASLCEAILNQGKELPNVLYVLARSRLELGNRDLARALLQRVLAIEAGHQKARELLARVDGPNQIDSGKGTRPWRTPQVPDRGRRSPGEGRQIQDHGGRVRSVPRMRPEDRESAE